MTLDELKAIGTDEEYLDFIRRQPSCGSGGFSEWTSQGLRNPACHVRRIKYGSGTGCKGSYNAIPLRHEEHDYQHRHGELGFLKLYRPFEPHDGQSAKEWFEQQVETYRSLWRLASASGQL